MVDAVLGVIALASPLAGEAGKIKTQLMINRIARRLALKEETVWARLEELRKQRRGNDAPRGRSEAGHGHEEGEPAGHPSGSAGPADLDERQLLEVLLADPALVAKAAASVRTDEIKHPGLRRLLQGLYDLHAAGEVPTLDSLRPGLENVRLAEKALELQEVGQRHPDREVWLGELLAHFGRRRDKTVQQELQSQLQAASDHAAALELLHRLQNRSRECPDTSSRVVGSGIHPPAPTA